MLIMMCIVFRFSRLFHHHFWFWHEKRKKAMQKLVQSDVDDIEIRSNRFSFWQTKKFTKQPCCSSIDFDSINSKNLWFQTQQDYSFSKFPNRISIDWNLKKFWGQSIDRLIFDLKWNHHHYRWCLLSLCTKWHYSCYIQKFNRYHHHYQ